MGRTKRTAGGPVEVIKKQLWQHGFKVKEVSGLGLGYDLLVEARWKVRVFNASESEPVIFSKIFAKQDGVVAIVYQGEKKYAFAEATNPERYCTWETNPRKIFAASGTT